MSPQKYEYVEVGYIRVFTIEALASVVESIFVTQHYLPGALCIMLGYKFHIAAPVFTACYWYLFLIEKSFWNNHSYLFGLVALLLSCTQADCYW